jgi:hypothetical protein
VGDAEGKPAERKTLHSAPWRVAEDAFEALLAMSR